MISLLPYQALPPFKLKGTLVRSNGLNLKIDQAYFTNQHEAIVIEPGGTIDLKNHTVDIHVTAIRLRQIHDFIKKVPSSQILYLL